MRRRGDALVAVAMLSFALAACRTTTRPATASPGTHPQLPTVTGISPVSGLTAGGTTVTIRGRNFVRVLAVHFGAVAAAHYVVVSTIRIRAVSPSQAASLQPLVVVTSAGRSTPSLTVAPFLYVAPTPRIDGMSPRSGPTGGGTTVRIDGSGFTAATAVSFGSIPAASFVVDSDREITAVAPSQAEGAYTVVVTTTGGRTPTQRGETYTYSNPPPMVETVTPSFGPTAGGTSVTIGGSGFTAVTVVNFGGVQALHFIVVSNTQITAVSPPEGPGARYVRVTSDAGTSKPEGAADQFTFRR